MKISSLFVCLLLFCHQICVQSYDRHYKQKRHHFDGNGIDCTNQVQCPDNNNGKSFKKSTRELIDCSQPNNCQINTLKSERQQSNDCHNQNDCQTPDYGDSRHGSHKRRAHKHRPNHINRLRYEEPSPQLIKINALQEWNCNFGTNDCGIHNQYNMGSYFIPMPESADPVLGRKGLLYLDLSRAHSAGARLITPYFATNGCRYGCLTIEYILCGRSIENLYLIQQDVRNYCIWQKRNDHSYRWTNTSVTIELSEGSPRFFIEFRFNPHLNKFGFIGISDMKFKYGECDHNEANECDLNHFVETLL